MQRCCESPERSKVISWTMGNRGLAAQADFGYDLDPDQLLSVCFTLSKPFNLDAVQT